MLDILVLCEYPVLNGGERSMLAILPAVAQRGLRIAVAGPPASPLEQAVRDAGLPFHALVLRESPTEPPPALSRRRERAAELIRRLLPRVVHANSLSMARLLGPILPEVRPAVGVGHLRDIIGLSRRVIEDMNRLDALVAVSQATRQWHIQQGIDASRLQVIRNGVDTEAFQPRPQSGLLHHELGIAAPARLVGGIGQLGMRKGWDVLLAAARQVAFVLPELHWVVAGDRNSSKAEAVEYERKLHRLADDAELAGRVHFLGRREDVPQLMNEFTLFVHPARQEPLGRVLLEAAAAGLPVIATDVGGTAEIFPRESDAARLVEPDDPEALAEQMRQLHHDAGERRRLGATARERAVQHFDARHASDQVALLYDRLLADPR